MPVIELIAECFFHRVCGWIGYVVVKCITLGKVEPGTGSIITELIGLLFTIAVVGSIAWMIHW